MGSESQFEGESKALLQVMVGTTAVGTFLLTKQVRVYGWIIDGQGRLAADSHRGWLDQLKGVLDLLSWTFLRPYGRVFASVANV